MSYGAWVCNPRKIPSNTQSPAAERLRRDVPFIHSAFPRCQDQPDGPGLRCGKENPLLGRHPAPVDDAFFSFLWALSPSSGRTAVMLTCAKPQKIAPRAASSVARSDGPPYH